MIKEIFNESYKEYKDYMTINVPDYWQYSPFVGRRWQCESVINAINDKFNFDKLVVVETGASHNLRDCVFGLFLGMAAVKTNGKMMAVDANSDVVDRSYELFKSVIPSLDYMVFISDSIKFLSNLTEIPNIVHLDSRDLDLINPFPAALHGWREFIAIESKMASGSIIIIDDNYIAGTRVQWFYPDGRIEWIPINYPMIGKGANIYHYVLSGDSNWNLIGEHYNIFNNIKIIIQKK
jgi:hypothetical protein